jgi:hypothetical protein
MCCGIFFGPIGHSQQQPSLLFYASWSRLEMKSHEPKKQGQNKSKKEREKQWTIKNQIKKRRKDNKMLSQKSEKGRKKT